MFAAHMHPSILSTLSKVAATQTPDDKQVEQAFAEQAYMMCSNKAGVLMKDPYRIGFEIITKNDDNTKLLGTWGYRLGRNSADQLLYAPCAFINGRILMTDLLYRVGPKKFVVHCPDWGQYLIDMEAQEYGKSQDKSDTARLHNQFRADRFMRTPAAFGKIASEDLPADWQTLVSDWCAQVKVGGVLRDFMVHVGRDTALDTLMSWMDKSARFERAMALHMPQDTWMPAEMPQDVKQAAAPDPVVLRFFSGAPTQEMLKRASNPEKTAAELYQRGWAMDVPDDVDPPEHFTVVYDGGPPVLRNPTGPGVCKIITAGGDKVKAVLGVSLHGWDLVNHDGVGPPCSPSGCNTSNRQYLNVLNIDDDQASGTLYRGNASIWSDPQDCEELADAGDAVEDISEGNLYCLLDPTTGELTSPVYILDKTKVGSVWHVMLACHPGSSGGELMIINPDAAKSRQRNVINTKWRAFRVKYKRRAVSSLGGSDMSGDRAPEWEVAPLAPAGEGDVTASLLAMPGVKEATLLHEKEAGMDLYTLRVGSRTTLLLRERPMALKLACDLLIHPETITTMLKRAQDNGVARFRVEPPTKLASAMLQIIDSPRFEQSFDNVHQVPVERDQEAVLRTQRTPIYFPNARIGDKLDSARGARNAPDSSMESQHRVPPEMIMTASPDELAQYAESRNLPHVFDHGVMASLAKTYDSQLFLDQYLVKLEDGLDAMARCLFLYYWKPQDWRQLYGADDLQELEDQMLSSFKSLGDLLLALLKKSRTSNNSPHLS